MSDVSRFRIVRLPVTRTPTSNSIVWCLPPSDSRGSSIVNLITALSPGAANLESASSAHRGAETLTVLAGTKRALLDLIVGLQTLLSERLYGLEPDELSQFLANASAARPGAPANLTLDADWNDVRATVALRLIADFILRERTASTMSLMLVMGLIEYHADTPALLASTDDVVRLMTRRTVILPAILMPPPNEERKWLLREPKCTDFYVVRSEWSCFVPGEIASIQNILHGERKETVHTRLEEAEVTTVREEALASLDERDHQSTERHELEEQATSQTQLQVGVEGQVDTAGQYGPTHVETHLGASFAYSANESRSRATRTAQEIVDISKSKVEQKVRTQRTQRTLQRIVEKNRHLFDNASNPKGHVRGVFRWVDKIQRLQLYRYPHRMIFDFMLPEPGSYLSDLWSSANAVEVEPEKPAPWTLAPNSITRSHYMLYVQRWRAEGVLPPPDEKAYTSATIAMKAESGTTVPKMSEEGAIVPKVSGTVDLTVPAGYATKSFRASIAGPPIMAKWLDVSVIDADGVKEEIGYHSIVGKCICAGATLSFASFTGNNVWSMSGAIEKTLEDPLAFPLVPPTVAAEWLILEAGPRLIDGGTGKLQAGFSIAGTFEAVGSVAVECTLTSEAFAKWQLETWDQIHRAYLAMKRTHDDWLMNQPSSPVRTIAGKSAAANAEEIRLELKRQIIEMILGGPLQPPDLLQTHTGIPSPFTPGAIAYGEAVKFVEQAFEWKNLTYIMYPSYWAPRDRWQELNLRETVDDELRRFIRAGFARVVVPARPGFENSVVYFGLTGLVWQGGPAPLPAEPQYLAIAQEIADAMSAPDEGEPVDMWEVKLPTTLVWLDGDSELPKTNEFRRLVGVPRIAICPSCASPNCECKGKSGRNSSDGERGASG